jgi:L-threonylcarbamoyladenylate synthase
MNVIHITDIHKRENKEYIVSLLKRDGIIIYPTDTLYGIGGNFFSLPVINRIDCLKQRDDMPYSVAAAGFAMIEKLTEELPPYFYELADKIFPGKVTVLLKAAKSLAKALLKDHAKIGVRIPAVAPIIELLEFLDIPLISTSVNKSGSPPLRDPEEMRREFPEVDLLIDAGVLPESQGSTILDLTASAVKVVRKGDDFAKIVNYLERLSLPMK